MTTDQWTTERLLTTAARLNNNHQNQLLAELNVTHVSATVLKALAESGPISQSGLAEILLVQTQTMGAVLAKLSQKGFVSRVRDPTNRRTILTRITSEGQRVLTQVDQAIGAPAKSTKPRDQELRKALIALITALEAQSSLDRADGGGERKASYSLAMSE